MSAKQSGSSTNKTSATFGSQVKDAWRWLVMRVQKAQLVSNLPRAYGALGKSLFEAGTYRDDFADIYSQLDACKARIQKVNDELAALPQPTDPAAKSKAVAEESKAKSQIRSLEKQQDEALRQLGQSAFEKHRVQSGPPELVRPIVDGRNRLASLNTEIARLSQAPPGTILTPKRIAIGGLVVVPLVIILVPLSFALIFGGNSQGDHASNPRDKVAAPADSHASAAVQPKDPFQKISGEWVGVDDAAMKLMVLPDKVVLTDPSGARTLPCQFDAATGAIKFKTPEANGDVVGTIEEGGNLHCVFPATGKTIVLHRKRWGEDVPRGGGENRGVAADLGRIRLGMSPAEVKAILGPPADDIESPFPEYRGVTMTWRYGPPGLDATLISFFRHGKPTGGVTLITSGGTVVLQE